jgi:hypothetical protein
MVIRIAIGNTLNSSDTQFQDAEMMFLRNRVVRLSASGLYVLVACCPAAGACACSR